MKYLRILLISLLILLLNSCGYKKLNSENLDNFKIDKLQIDGEKKIAYKLKNNIEIYSSQKAKFIYDVKINLISTKETKIKNTSGKTIRYSTKLVANTLITSVNTRKKYTMNFSSTNDYDVSSAHSDTLKNEKNAAENNLNYISNEIVKYLKLLNI